MEAFAGRGKLVTDKGSFQAVRYDVVCEIETEVDLLFFCRENNDLSVEGKTAISRFYASSPPASLRKYLVRNFASPMSVAIPSSALVEWEERNSWEMQADSRLRACCIDFFLLSIYEALTTRL